MRGPDGDDARAEFNANGDVVVRREAPLAEADGEARLAASRVADADELGNVVPRRGHWGEEEGDKDRWFGCLYVQKEFGFFFIRKKSFGRTGKLVSPGG